MSPDALRSALQSDLDGVKPIRAAKVLLGKSHLARQLVDGDTSLFARVVLVPTSFAIGPIPKTASIVQDSTWKRAVYAFKQSFEVHCWARTEGSEKGDELTTANAGALSSLLARTSVALRRFGTDESVQPSMNGQWGNEIKDNEYGCKAVFTATVIWPVFAEPYDTVTVTPGVTGAFGS